MLSDTSYALRVTRNAQRAIDCLLVSSMADDGELQALSRILFGQAHRLAVMFAVAQGDGLFNPGDVAAELGFRAQSSIQDPLRDLEKAGLITRSPKVGNRVYYTRNPSKVWAWIEEIVAKQAELAEHRIT